MRHLPLILALALLPPAACAGLKHKAGLTAADADDIADVAQIFTGKLFKAQQPAITTAVAHLPPETQALAQAAYAALQKSIDAALEKGVYDLSTVDQHKTQAALIALGQATDHLHATLHAEGDPVLVPIPPVDPAMRLPGTPTVPVVVP